MKKSISFLKVIGIVFVGIVILIVSQAISSIFYNLDLNGLQYILTSFCYIGMTFFLSKLFIEKILHQTLNDYQITSFTMKKEWILIAFLLPIIVMTMIVLFVPGTFSINEHSVTQSIEILLYAIFDAGLGAGIVEELIFRGLIFSTLAKNYNIKVAVLIPSILFGAIHLLNGTLSFESFIMLLIGGTLVGIMFSLLAYKNKTIWASAVVHAVWNTLVIGGVCKFGFEPDQSYFTNYIFTTKSLFLTGGDFGVEVSIFSILGFCTVILYLLKPLKAKKHP